MDITIEPWKKLIIHEIIEYQFDDWVKQIAFSTRSSGGGIPTMQWTNELFLHHLVYQLPMQLLKNN